MRARLPRPIALAVSLAVLTVLGVVASVGSARPIAGPLAGSPTGTAGALAPATPARPSAFSLGEDGFGPASISLNWTESTALTFENYTVYVSNVSATGPWRFVTSITDEGTTTVGVADLDPGLTYWWNVTAYSSVLGLGTTATYSPILPWTQPTLAYLVSPANTTSTINLSWTNNASYGGVLTFGAYAVEEVDDGTTTTYENLTSASDNATTVKGLTAGASYSFYIDTYDACSDCVPAGPSMTQSNVIVAGTATPLTAAVTASRTTVDARVLVAFTCTPSGGTPPYAFGWNFSNGTGYPAGPGTTSHAFDKASSAGYLVRCQVTDHTGIRYVPPAVVIVVNHDPRVVATASPVNVTVGESVAFGCTASRGTAPLTVGWALGDGATIAGVGDAANGSASYGSNGTYVAQCTVTDSGGGKAVASVVIQVRKLPPFAWLTPAIVLAASAGAGALLALLVFLSRRRVSLADQSSALSRWLPPAGPATLQAAKVCPKCGASNVPLRRSCQVCGTSLPRNPGS